MQTTITTQDSWNQVLSDCSNPIALYEQGEQQFNQLLTVADLDQHLSQYSERVSHFEAALHQALVSAYDQNPGCDAAHTFLQRILYRINRLNLFWYDDLSNYANERSYYLQKVRDRIESVWQNWELQTFDLPYLQQLSLEELKTALTDRATVDLDPPLSETRRYIREQMTVAGYKCLLAIASFDGLVEASRLSRILGGASNEVQATLIRVLLEEYGNGRLSRKHSTFFAQMMAELGLDTRPEGYFDIVPWQVLASINHNFLLTERKRHFLRYNGGLTYFEIVGPAIYTDYLMAAQRLGLSDTAMGYWELHIREDERHGRWMVDEVALPLVDQYPKDAWEIVLGYDQERYMAERAGQAVGVSIHRVDLAGAFSR